MSVGIEKKISSEVCFPGKMITVTYDVAQLENGREAWREVVHHPGASAVILQKKDGTIVMEYQYRYALAEILLEIPAGKLDQGEDPIICAKRELQEETGYVAEHWTALGSIATSPGFCNEIIHIYFATDESKGENHLDDDEFVDLVYYTKEELLTMIRDGRLKDAKSISALMMAMPYLK